MALIDDLIRKIDDSDLRERIQEEVKKINKQKKFGLVFEEHIPEYTALYGREIKKGDRVTFKDKRNENIYFVEDINNKTAVCINKETKEKDEYLLKNLVTIAEFGDPIYPYLKYVDSINNAPDSDLWHILIESDNYHALQLLEYIYSGKIDCIYIDPPYNTGDKSWKYNNNYVDSNDAFKHSKWLSMMEKRLLLARKLLNPRDSVLICTIDEKEYIHLGSLLEDLFPEARIQMISTVINPKGVARSGFSRSDEYIFFVMFGKSAPEELPLSNEWSSSAKIVQQKTEETNKTQTISPEWTSMMRRGNHSHREDSPGLYYPIYADPNTKTIQVIGEVLPLDKDRGEEIEGLVQILPIRTNKAQGVWQLSPEELRRRLDKGYVRLGRKSSYGFVVNYLSKGQIDKIEEGFYDEISYAKNGSIIATKEVQSGLTRRKPPTQWKIASHDASEHGTNLLKKIIGEKRFDFPKSVYAVKDTIRFFVENKPNAIILDFFAGSGTTTHAVNLLNSEDNGNRQSIMVTNNEISSAEEKELSKKGYQHGDEEWEKLGIARYVTWPRTLSSITGIDQKGKTIKGDYYDTKRKISDGFKSNAIYFKLGFLDKNEVALGRQLIELLPILWMKAGAKGKCPQIDDSTISDGLIYPNNNFAILNNESRFSDFKIALEQFSTIDVVYIVTDSDEGYVEMASQLNVNHTYQLYRDYLDNFRINLRR